MPVARKTTNQTRLKIILSLYFSVVVRVKYQAHRDTGLFEICSINYRPGPCLTHPNPLTRVIVLQTRRRRPRRRFNRSRIDTNTTTFRSMEQLLLLLLQLYGLRGPPGTDFRQQFRSMANNSSLLGRTHCQIGGWV